MTCQIKKSAPKKKRKVSEGRDTKHARLRQRTNDTMTAAASKGTTKEDDALLEAEIAKIQKKEKKRAKKKKDIKHVPTTTKKEGTGGTLTGPSTGTTTVPGTSDAVHGDHSSPPPYSFNSDADANATRLAAEIATARLDADHNKNEGEKDPALLDAEIAKSATRIMKHMNTDHEDSLMAYVLAFATGIEEVAADPTSAAAAADDDVKKDQTRLLHNIRHGNNQLVLTAAQLTKVDRRGFVLEIHAIDADLQSIVLSQVRVPFDVPITAAREIHHVAVRMHRQAYDTLGIVYKLHTGYYPQVLKFVAFKSYKMIQQHKVVVVAGVLAVSTMVVARHRSRTTTTKQ